MQSRACERNACAAAYRAERSENPRDRSGAVSDKLGLKLKTHGVENRRRFSTSKTDMADKVGDDTVAAALFISVVANR